MKVASIRQTRFIRAEPDEVYNAFMNGKTHAAFTGAKATCNVKVGGKFATWDGYITGKNLKTEEGQTDRSRVEDHGMPESLSILDSRVLIQTEERRDASKNGAV
jgi:hypothetical protein